MNSARRYHHGHLRDALLAAAAEIVTQQGADALTIRECARRAGVSHSAPLNHFPDRAALLTALIDQKWSEFADALAGAIDPNGEPRSNFLAVGKAYIAFAQANRHAFDLMMRPEMEPCASGPAPEGALRARATLRESMAACLENVERLDLCCDFAWSLVHGYIDIARMSAATTQSPDGLDVMLRMLFSGIG